MKDISRIKSFVKVNMLRYRIGRSISAGAAPVLVHQMGKVGSTSLCQTLRSMGGLPPVVQTHFLTEKGIARAYATFKNWDSPPPSHLRISKMISPFFLQKYPTSNLMWYVATMVRDPIARQISDIYQNPEIVGQTARGIPDPQVVLSYLSNYFQNFDEPTDYVCHWFDTEFVQLLDIQVYERNFSEKHYDIFKKKNVRALVFRLEDFSDIGHRALEKWLGRPVNFRAQQLNTSRERDSFNSYQSVKENLKIKRSDLEKVYSTKFSRYFYGDMKSQLIDYWAN